MRNDMVGGLNAFFKDQAREPGKCLVDYTMFDTKYEVAFTDTPVSAANAVLEPRGGTALLDAIGKTTVNLGEKFAAMSEDERPGTVIVVVVTDGYENSSVEWTAEGIKALVEKKQNEYNWKFVFLGANMDAVKTAGNYGFAQSSTMTYDSHSVGATTQSLSGYTTTTRSGGAAAFSDEDRKKAMSGS